VKIDAVHAIAHNKIMIIDGETVITGSFNFIALGSNLYS
jgi:phosphatidylserine/phosphatidylglycerophosphate/cardiolipin synthase-like enzyme